MGEHSPFSPGMIGPVSVRNRFIKAATFEGRSSDGEVSDDLIEFHRATAAGGVGVVTVAYLAVAPEGRTDKNVIVLTSDKIARLQELTSAIAAEGAVPAAQIGHAGPVANAASNGVPAYGPRKLFHPLSLRFIRAATEDDLQRIVQEYARGAAVAAEAGFRVLEVHAGHHYLLSSFLSPFMNHRTDRYGGELANRARLAREVFHAVRNAIPADAAITVKLNMTDGIAAGTTLEDSRATLAMLESDGTVDAAELTAGSSFAAPMYLFKGPAPLKAFGATLPWFLRPGFKIFGSKFFRASPYRDGYFMESARTFLESANVPLIALGGMSSLPTVNAAIDDGFSFVALGRPLLAEPDLINRWAAGNTARARCTHCNLCIPTIYSGTRCVEFQVPSNTISGSSPD